MTVAEAAVEEVSEAPEQVAAATAAEEIPFEVVPKPRRRRRWEGQAAALAAPVDACIRSTGCASDAQCADLRHAREDAPAELAATDAGEASAQPEEVVLVMSTSGGRHWGVNVAAYHPVRGRAGAFCARNWRKGATLNDSLRKVSERGGGYDANFMGPDAEQADLACRRLQARAIQCFTIV